MSRTPQLSRWETREVLRRGGKVLCSAMQGWESAVQCYAGVGKCCAVLGMDVVQGWESAVQCYAGVGKCCAATQSSTQGWESAVQCLVWTLCRRWESAVHCLVASVSQCKQLDAGTCFVYIYL